ncbi:DUF6090 family protein [Hanstruepera ponticola]|uniref:DUF6090 family protein n=1 Tax=Hanstruepera ponticola TaxID=2042995 RepID=UPI000CF15162|nr:DUF6090 family protein [Hanstruepera ponticola]
MVTLLRKIRRNLVSQNRFNKYMLYAIGEIILVVIGILIALQINDWNDQKKKSDLEIKILKEIDTNLSFDLEEIREDISLMDSIEFAAIDIVDYISNHEIPSEKFNYNVAKMKVAPHFNPNKSGYELLSSKGVEIVVNDSLRIAISDLYESYYPYYNQYEKERIMFKSNLIQPYFLKYFSWMSDLDKYFLTTLNCTQDDYLKLKNNDSFIKLIRAIDFENKFVRLRAKTMEEKIINLKRQISEALKNN